MIRLIAPSTLKVSAIIKSSAFLETMKQQITLFERWERKSICALALLDGKADYNISKAMTKMPRAVYFSTFMKKKDRINQVHKKILSQQQQQYQQSFQLTILTKISEMKTQQNVQQVYQAMQSMNKSNKEITLKYLLSAVYKKNLPISILSHQQFKSSVSEFSNLKLETELYRINQLLAEIQKIRHTNHHQVQAQTQEQESVHAQKQTQAQTPVQAQKQTQIQEQKALQRCYNQVNDLFYECFNKTLGQIEEQNINRSKAALYKQFAKYYFDYLFDPVAKDKKQQNLKCLHKSIEFLRESFEFHKLVILSELEKKQQQDIKKFQQKDNQRHLITQNAIRENIRKLIQSLGECLYAHFKVINKEYRVTKDSEKFRIRKIQLLSFLQNYMPMYSVIPGTLFITQNKGIKPFSTTYFKLAKIKIQSQFTALNPPKTQQQSMQKIKQTIRLYLHLFEECKNSVSQVQKLNNFESMKELAVTMISVKFMISTTLRESQETVRLNLANTANDIIQMTKPEWKQHIMAYLKKIIKQLLKVKS